MRVTFLADAGLETVAVPARTLQNSNQISGGGSPGEENK
jgi:hypothetical protein